MEYLPKRVTSHQLASESVIKLKEVIPFAWNVYEYPTQNDYGIDMRIEIFESEKPIGKEFNIQLKATEKSSDKKKINWPMKNISYLMNNALPSLLVFYHKSSNQFYAKWVDSIFPILHKKSLNDNLGKSILITFAEIDKINNLNFRKFIYSGIDIKDSEKIKTLINLCLEPTLLNSFICLGDASKEIEFESFNTKYDGSLPLFEKGLVRVYYYIDKDEYWNQIISKTICIGLSKNGQYLFELYKKNQVWLEKLKQYAKDAWACAG